MREAIRDIDRLRDDLSSRVDDVRRRARGAQRASQATTRDVATPADQARYALWKARADLAQAAITRQIEPEAHAAAPAASRSAADDEERRLADSLAALTPRRTQVAAELRAVERERAAVRSAERSETDDRIAR